MYVGVADAARMHFHLVNSFRRPIATLSVSSPEGLAHNGPNGPLSREGVSSAMGPSSQPWRKMRNKKIQIFFHSNSGLGGHFQHFHSGADRLDIAACHGPVEFNRLGQIHLRDYRD